jgi:hypothetical protein
VVLGVFGEVAQRGGLANPFLDVELRPEHFLTLLLHCGLFLGTDNLHDDSSKTRCRAPHCRTRGSRENPTH